MILGIGLLALVALCGAEKWQWPEGAASVKIDTKVRFIDAQRDKGQTERVADEPPFQEALETEGFYNRPRGAGRYPVRVEPAPPGSTAYLQPLHNGNNYASDGTLDSLQYCKCASTPECQPHRDSARACGPGRFLCCYNKPNQGNQQNTEYFNEIDDERPMLLPGRESIARPFPPPAGAGPGGYFGSGQHHEGGFVGPQSPSGTIGSHGSGKQDPGVLVGPGGPTGIVGPANKGVLVGPEGPIDPLHPDETAQRGVLVGPGGPTGIIGPQGGYGRRPVLVGPGGPTGRIGPRRPNFGGYFNNGYGRQMGRGLLVGPGGPTGSIGPARGVLVGPDGPTGLVGPQGYFGK